MTDYHPNYCSPPGDTIFEMLVERGISERELADHLGKPEAYVTDLLYGLIAISPELAQRLSIILKGPSADFWLRRDAAYQQFLTDVAHATRHHH